MTYEKPFKRLILLLGLLIISPIILNVAFKALKIYKEEPGIYVAYALVCIGIFLILYTVYFGFMTFRLFLNTLFKDHIED